MVETIYPENDLCPWLIPAHFDTENMPRELKRGESPVLPPFSLSPALDSPLSLQLTKEEFSTAMEMLTHDFR